MFTSLRCLSLPQGSSFNRGLCLLYISPSKSNVPRVLKANTVLVTSKVSESKWDEADDKKNGKSSLYIIIIWCKVFFIFIDQEPTTWLANNCQQNNDLLMCNFIQLCSAANKILLMRKWSHAFLLVLALAWKWQIIINKPIQRPNDKIIN